MRGRKTVDPGLHRLDGPGGGAPFAAVVELTCEDESLGFSHCIDPLPRALRSKREVPPTRRYVPWTDPVRVPGSTDSPPT